MHLQISQRDIVENLSDVVDRALDTPDPPGVGVQCVFLHWFGTRGLLAPGPETTSQSWDPTISWSLGPEWPLGAGTQRHLGPQDPKRPPGAGTWRHLGPRDPKRLATTFGSSNCVGLASFPCLWSRL
jgi:hypothetical protein